MDLLGGVGDVAIAPSIGNLLFRTDLFNIFDIGIYNNYINNYKLCRYEYIISFFK